MDEDEAKRIDARVKKRIRELKAEVAARSTDNDARAEFVARQRVLLYVLERFRENPLLALDAILAEVGLTHAEFVAELREVAGIELEDESEEG